MKRAITPLVPVEVTRLRWAAHLHDRDLELPIVLAIDAGLSVEELVRVKRSALLPLEKAAHLEFEGRRIPVSPDARLTLGRWPLPATGTVVNLTTVALRRRLAAVVKRCDLVGMTWHCLAATYPYMRLRGGARIERVAEALGCTVELTVQRFGRYAVQRTAR